MGKEIWKGIDAQQYIEEERNRGIKSEPAIGYQDDKSLALV